jgi:hypothetical protein
MVMVEPVLTFDAVPLEAFWAKRGINVPAALTMRVPVMWHVAVVTVPGKALTGVFLRRLSPDRRFEQDVLDIGGLDRA